MKRDTFNRGLECYSLENIRYEKRYKALCGKGLLGFLRGRKKCSKCPLQESNLQLALRRGSLYPFN